MSLARYFVFRRGTDWMVVLEGTALSRHPTREGAVNSAIVMADLMGSMHHDADVMIEDAGGLDIVWAHGTDDLPTARNVA